MLGYVLKNENWSNFFSKIIFNKEKLGAITIYIFNKTTHS